MSFRFWRRIRIAPGVTLNLSKSAGSLSFGPLEALVHAEGQHHEGDEDGAKVFLAQAVVVFEVVALVLQGVEGFVFDAPARPADPHQGNGVFQADEDVRDPGKPQKPLGGHLPVLEEVQKKTWRRRSWPHPQRRSAACLCGDRGSFRTHGAPLSPGPLHSDACEVGSWRKERFCRASWQGSPAETRAAVQHETAK
ncbi:DUF4236 domain-containing protein [Desulfoglaeba alkanexedens ALDC]|uniref:DUF4236 domain-containing protein n=1 Tax=Desulfoglaeba alkanexedens ALDC TaxID=980445 RepID=A0A4P8L2H4_9BACT|nr:DUF4236 domain-containing protein [Desulfoglaeba alkanexedens ALDC]